jgi:hypothetical protein
MGHVLHAIIGPKVTVTAFVSRWARARLVDLPLDFALVPLTPSLHDDIVELADIHQPDPFHGFERLSAGIGHVLCDISRVGPFAYIETDYIGGVGVQRAVAWKGGLVLTGPFTSETFWDETGPQTKPPGERAINRVLSAIGVWTRGDVDPFDMIGLGKFRDTLSVAEKHP